MSDWRSARKKFYEAFDILGSLFWARAAARMAPELRKFRHKFFPRKHRKWIAGALLVSAAGGFAALRYVEAGASMGLQFETAPHVFARMLFGKNIPVPGYQADGAFLFSDFERLTDFRAWKFVSAEVVPSMDHAPEGKMAAEINFVRRREEFGSVVMSGLMKSMRGVSDWSRFQSIDFSLFNPQRESQNLKLLVVDIKGKTYKEDLTLPPSGSRDFSVPVSGMAAQIDARQIDSFAFYARMKTDQTYYLDNVRLVPKSGQERSRRRLLEGAVGRPVRPFDYNFARRRPAWVSMDPVIKGEAVRVPFILKNETAVPLVQWPAKGGIPFPRGELKSLSNIRVRNDQNEDLVFEARILSRWPDGSVRWLGLEFDASLKPQEGKGFFLEYGPNVRTIDFDRGVRLEEDKNHIRVETAEIRAVFDKKTFYLFDEVYFDRDKDKNFSENELMISKAALYLASYGAIYRGELDRESYRIEVEELGRQRAVVKASGWFVSQAGKRFCQAIVRIKFYAGKNFVTLSHTFVYTGYPENKFYNAYKGLDLPANETVESFGLSLPYRMRVDYDPVALSESGRSGIISVDHKKAPRIIQTGRDDLLQRTPTLNLPSKDFLTGWMDVSVPNCGITVTVREFRENFPKAFGIDPVKKEILVDLWPREAGELDLSTSERALGPGDAARGSAFGLAKTHELLIDFHANDFHGSPARANAYSFMAPLVLRVNPYWIDATGALGRLFPAAPMYAEPEKILENLFDWAMRQPADEGWHGMLDYGDTLSWYRNSDESGRYRDWGWHPAGQWGWYNGTGVGVHTGALIQFLRTGYWKYYMFGRNLARHVMDVDTVHYNTISNDPRLRSVLNEEFSRVGSMHRRGADHWSGRSEQAADTNIAGLLLYYYISGGDERALDVLRETGDFYLSEPFTFTGHPDIAPQAAVANTLWGDVLLFELTGEDQFKDAADKVIDILLAGQQEDGSFLEYYNPVEKKWGGQKSAQAAAWYTLGALKAYHELTQDTMTEQAFLKAVRGLAPDPFMGPSILHGIAYAYHITEDPFFVAAADGNLRRIMASIKASSDPKFNGLIYDKAIYHQPMAFLPTVPYVFGALEANAEKQKRP